MFAIGLLHRFLYLILDPLAFVPNTFYTHNLSKYSLFQSRSQKGLFQTPGLHTCFGLNLNRSLNNTNVFASKPSFTQRAVLHKNCVLHKHHVLHKNHVLAGPVQGLFAAYRMALSMVAGGTRQRRLNMGSFPVCFWSCAIYGSGKHDQTARTPVAKAPQIQHVRRMLNMYSPVLRGKRLLRCARYINASSAMYLALVHGATTVSAAS